MEKLEGFDYKECVVAGDECYLVTPLQMGTDWTEANKHLRSAIIRRSDGFVVSMGFRKFVNFHETPSFEPWDASWPVKARHKMDGSLLIVSKYKGQLICRTRGTVDARQLPNGHEVDTLLQKYPLIEQFYGRLAPDGISSISLLFEWTTPTNVIVVREHEEPTLTLLGVVNNQTGKYETQESVDLMATVLEVARPKTYSYKSIAECLADVAAWQGSEGVVLYSPDGQTLKKIKAEEYLRLHRLKSSVSSVRSLINLYVEEDLAPDAEAFFEYIELTLDYEIARYCRANIDQIVKAHVEVNKQKREVRDFVSKFTLMSRKELAFEIQTRWRDWRKGYAFSFLDGKDLDKRTLARIIEENLK